ncbi:piwi-like protein 3 [Eulemur rufifrons]|uniref:piwi-like protein 3 n=1 Tax=Eulemur rufifrons TaxID=859984 RepID=UPI0037438FB9
MTGRARTRARGRARSWEIQQQEAPGAAAGTGSTASHSKYLYLNPEPLGRSSIPGPLTSNSPFFLPEELELVPGLRTVSLQQKSVFQDLVVNTRQRMEHVRVSKTGSEGQVVRLLANHFRVTSRPQWIAYKYNVNYQPDIESGNLRANLLSQYEEIGKCYIFDGNSLLLPYKLRKPKTVFSRESGTLTVTVTIEFSRDLTPNAPDCLRFYNILFRRTLKSMDWKQVGRNYYNDMEAVKFSETQVKLEIWPGYATSILQYENSITLCADVNHKLIRIQTAYDLMNKIATDNKERIREKIADELVGSIVMTRYNNRTYRVDGIAWERTPKDTFEKSDGERITYIDYYSQQHKVLITDDHQPLLISQGKWKKGQKDTKRDPILLVPQLCVLTGLTDEVRKDYMTMKALADHTRLNPEKRHHELKKFINTIQTNKSVQKELRYWDLNFDSNFLSFSGRTLTTVNVQKERRVRQVNSQGQWILTTSRVPLFTPTPLTRWLMLYSRSDDSAASSLKFRLETFISQMGIQMKPVKMIAVDGADAYQAELQRQTKEPPQMVVCLLSNDEKDRYDKIKKYLCTACPTPSQCVVAKTLKRPKILTVVCEKLAQQMVCKMGGALWKVDTGIRKAMFVGIDCFHDTVNRKKSIAGFVASTTDELTKWYSQCVIQEAGEEIVNGLTDCLRAALEVWYQNESCMPRSVIVYRDGVGDGQLQALLDHEIPQMLACLKNIPSRENVALTFIVVKKRINTRFFAISGRSLQNPNPGTVIDVELTRKEWYDFFIVSQSVREGTVTPTHYNVIYDTVCLRPNTVQRLTYQLCHMYYNWAGIIRVPAPCHYAHKLAYLVGQSIHEQPDSSLSTLLYYL